MTDVELLRRRVNTLTRAAQKIATHCADLHDLGWERHVGDVEKVKGGTVDHSPKVGNPKARHLFERIFREIASIEAELVGLERSMTGLFFAGSSNPEPSRGSMISRAEFERLKKNQGPDSSPKLIEQPSHPGERR